MFLPFPDGQLSLALGRRWVMMLLGVFKALIHVCVCVCVCACVCVCVCVCVCCISTSALLSKLIRKRAWRPKGNAQNEDIQVHRDGHEIFMRLGWR